MNLQKSIRHESKRLRESARGKECQIRIPGVCCGDNSTVVLCHLNGAGAGKKHSDLLASYGCHKCHAACDGQLKTAYHSDELKLMLLEGVMRTQQIMLDDGLITLA